MTLDWPNLLVGAVLGAVASIVFAIVGRLVWLIWNRFPLRTLLGDLADDKKAMSVFLRDMKSADGQYYSLGNAVCQPPSDWFNISSVVARADVEPATDILNLLGQAGRTLNITWRQIERDGDLWDEPLICVGGSPQAKKSLELCIPQLLRYEPVLFRTLLDEKFFKPNSTSDYAVIYRGRHRGTGAVCLVVFGGGEAATRAAGAYLRRHARDLGKLYFLRPFAAVIRVGWQDGKDVGTIVWLSRTISWGSLLFLPTLLRHYQWIARKSKREHS